MIFQRVDSSFSLIGLPLRWFKDSVFLRILFSGMSLMYLFVCFFRSWFLFRIPFVDTYGLYYHHTDVYALAFNAEYVCRIQFSLCYHFVMLLQLNESEYGSIALSSLLGQMKAHALELYDAVLQNRFEDVGRLVRRSWAQNCRLDEGTNPPAVRRITERVDDLCLGYKLPGAGGGGYLYMVHTVVVKTDRSCSCVISISIRPTP